MAGAKQKIRKTGSMLPDWLFDYADQLKKEDILQNPEYWMDAIIDVLKTGAPKSLYTGEMTPQEYELQRWRQFIGQHFGLT